jgi:hypothetical protein
MGALTSKIKAFNFRVWEQRLFKEIDDTEAYLSLIRVENLKIARSRVLPIRYWISNEKRFSNLVKVIKHSLLKYNIEYCFKPFILYEKQNISYLTRFTRSYFKLFNKLKLATGTDFFFGKKISFTTYNQLLSLNKRVKIYTNHLLSPSFYKIFDSSDSIYSLAFKKHLEEVETIIFLTNPRLDSPAFYTFLYQYADHYTYISYGNFTTNLFKEEFPLNINTILLSLEGKFDFKNTALIVNFNFLNIHSLFTIPSVYTISPSYLHTNLHFDTFVKNKQQNTISLHLSLQPKLHGNFLVSPINTSSNAEIYLPLYNADFFDRFLLASKYTTIIDRIYLLHQIFINREANALKLRFLLGARDQSHKYYENSALGFLYK